MQMVSVLCKVRVPLVSSTQTAATESPVAAAVQQLAKTGKIHALCGICLGMGPDTAPGNPSNDLSRNRVIGSQSFRIEREEHKSTNVALYCRMAAQVLRDRRKNV
jgi:hypothetical protein